MVKGGQGEILQIQKGDVKMNKTAGICADCGSYWTLRAGGLNDDERCPKCAEVRVVRKRRVRATGNVRLVAVNELGARIGEDHPNAKYPNGLIDLVLALRDEGWGYKLICRVAQMPKRTVRDICNGRRRCQRPDRLKRVRVPDGDDG